MCDAPQSSRKAQWLGFLPVALVFVFMAWISWRRCPDLLIDFGMQLYVPWKLSQGSVLYRDIAYLPGGPLSQYFNAAIFSIFGVSLLNLMIANLTVFALLVIGVYRSFLSIAPVWVASLLSLTIVVMFGFAQITDDLSNYTYVCPYSHDLVHGGVLCILTLSLLHRWLRHGSIASVVGIGFTLGLIFLTKVELFFAIAVTIAFAFWLRLKLANNKSELLKAVGLIAGCAVLPALGFFFYFLRFENATESMRSVCGGWVTLFTSKVATSVYYRWCMGLDAPGQFIMFTICDFISFVVLIGLLILRFRFFLPSWERILILATVGAAGLAYNWGGVASCMTLVSPLMTLALLWRFKSKPAERNSLMLPILWSVCGLLLLAKMGVRPRIWHYGFVLAMPSFIALVYFLIWLLPRWLEAVSVQRDMLTGVLVCFLVVGLFRVSGNSCATYLQRDYPVNDGPDRLYAVDPKVLPMSEAFAKALVWIKQNVSSNQTLAILPEGATLNYLSRRTNPTPYPVFMAEVSAFGEERMVAAYKEKPPNFIVQVDRNAWEYSIVPFGEKGGFGYDLMQWVRQNYELIDSIKCYGPRGQFAVTGAKLFRRKAH